MSIRKNALEIIDETVLVYSVPDNRSVNFIGGCDYYYRGRTCAVGRCCEDAEALQNLINEKCLSNTDVRSIRAELNWSDKWLKQEYRGQSINFWSDLQTLHDTSVYWCSKGLTEDGQAFVDILKRKYENE